MEQQIEKFLASLNATDMDPRCIEQAGARVPKLLIEFTAGDGRHSADDAGESAGKQAQLTLQHLTTAARNAGDGTPSRREARKLLRFVACCDDFAELSRRASRFRGRHNRNAHRIKERAERALERVIRIDGVHSVREVRTSAQLKTVGKTLRNCLAGRLGTQYHQELRNGKTEFWVVRRHNRAVGVLSIDAESRKLGEFSGKEQEPLELQAETLEAMEWHLNTSFAPKQEPQPEPCGQRGPIRQAGEPDMESDIEALLAAAAGELVETLELVEAEVRDFFAAASEGVEAIFSAFADAI